MQFLVICHPAAGEDSDEFARLVPFVHRGLVAAALVLTEGRRFGPLAGQAGRQRIREQLGVAQGVADPQRAGRLLVASGVPDQRPAGPVRLAQEVRQVRGTVDALLTSS